MAEINTTSECSVATKKTSRCVPEIIDILAREYETQSVDEMKSKTGCDTEVCVVEQNLDILNDKQRRAVGTYYKRHGPANVVERKWLSNSDIDGVLSQLGARWPDFMHLHFQMRDFVKSYNELRELDLSELFSGRYKTFACVLNTDVSTGSGKHWVCLFGDFRHGGSRTIEYFDSAGSAPMGEIIDWYTNVLSVRNEPVCSVNGGDCDDVITFKQVTSVKHQKKNTECGVYVLYYIYSRLLGHPWSDFTNPLGVINDDFVAQFRGQLFRK